VGVSWFERAKEISVLGRKVLVIPADEMLLSKIFVASRRDRYDMSGVLHLIFTARGTSTGIASSPGWASTGSSSSPTSTSTATSTRATPTTCRAGSSRYSTNLEEAEVLLQAFDDCPIPVIAQEGLEQPYLLVDA